MLIFGAENSVERTKPLLHVNNLINNPKNQGPLRPARMAPLSRGLVDPCSANRMKTDVFA
jgi:hypothetical protein